jgi:glucosamine--fructose-6-phosphate aminotransferase (isomerizing)
MDGKAAVGIAHTRWATHGAPTDKNAHPHCNNSGDIAVVHNGIIENYQSLKRKLSAMGCEFKSDTDTEVLAHLIGHVKALEPDLSLASAVSLALTQVRGAYGIAVVEKGNPDTLIGARKGSPLILGLGEDHLVLASDATAVVGLTEKVIYLMDEDIVTCKRGADGKYSQHVASMKREALAVGAEPDTPMLRRASESGGDSGAEEDLGAGRLNRSLTRNLNANAKSISAKVLREMHELTLNLETIEKGGYDHFMLKEIMEQPKVLMDCMRGRINPLTGEITFGGLASVSDRLTNARRIIICACGTSWHSALVAEYLIETHAKIPVEVEYASEFRYRNPVLFKDDVVIVISQSGETADTLEAIRIAKQVGALVLGVVNVVGSSIARETDSGMYLHVGPEIGVASTKAFTGQVMALTMLSVFLGKASGNLSIETANAYGLKLLKIPELIEEVLTEEKMEKIKEMASTYRYAHNFLYLGRGYNFPVALEGALKLKEISYIHAEGYPAAEMKHGPIALIDQMMPVVVIAPKGDPTYEKVLSGIEEVVARKGAVIVITDSENTSDLQKVSDYIISTPRVDDFLYPLIAVVPLQLMSYYIAKFRGCEIDQPRNLAKSVTVE